MEQKTEQQDRTLAKWDRSEIVNAAKRWIDAGFLVGPARPSDKRPHLKKWATIYKGKIDPPTIDDIEQHILIDQCCDGIGVFGGAASRCLEMLELDTSDAELYAEFIMNVGEAGLADVWDAITAGYEEQTPGGGRHWPFCVSGGDNKGNIKLALPEPTGDSKQDSKATIETRGNGGWFVIAPSAGRTHPTGRPYVMASEDMDPANIATITVEQRDGLYDCARACCKGPKKAAVKPKPAQPNVDSDSAGNKFISQTTWEDILVPLGWHEGMTYENAYGIQTEWARPGKDPNERSGIVSGEIDQMIVWSSATVLEPTNHNGETQSFSRWAVWTFYHYDGDFQKSAKAVHQAVDAGMDWKELAKGTPPPPPKELTFAKPEPPENRSKIVTVATDIMNTGTYTEISLGRLLADQGHGQLKYIVDRKTWAGFNGRQWIIDNDALLAQELGKRNAVTLIHNIADAVALNQSVPANAMTFAKQAAKGATIKSAVSLARSEPDISILSEAFDQDGWKLNVHNGILDLRNREKLPHAAKAYITKYSDVDYEPTAVCPLWEEFVNVICCGDGELASFMQRSFGLALTSDQSAQHLWIHYGDGSNGKGTFFAIMEYIMGSYAGPCPMEVFLQTGGDNRERAVLQLVGKRLAFAQEADDGKKLSEATIKALTGSDTMTARQLFKEAFTVRPTWHLHMAVNDRPSIGGQDRGIWRRVLLVPWLHTFKGSEERGREEVEAELLQEKSGILNWLLDGLDDWKASGLNPPPAVTNATESYRADSDSVRAWAAECCEDIPGGMVLFSELYRSYVRYCDKSGYTAVSKTKLGTTLTAMGYENAKPTHGDFRKKSVRVGMKLNAEWPVNF